MKNVELEKIDRFYLTLSIVLILMTVLFVFSVRGALNVFLSSQEVDSLATEDVKVRRDKLNDAYNFAFRKEVIKLEVK